MHSCDVCNSTFATEEAATRHKKSTRHCVCKYCDKVLASSQGVKTHVGAVHECPQCAETFTKESLLTQHRKAEEHCFCVVCKRLFGTVQRFNTHIKALHYHKCPQCPVAFTKEGPLTEHRKDAQHCFCVDCKKAFPTVQRFDAHIKALHYHKCPQCLVTFTKESLLIEHRKAGHCFCVDYNKSFGTVGDFRDHMQSSRHSTKFRCRDCDREFNSTNALDQHRASLAHHPLGIVYCRPCRATFPSASALLQHRESGACPSGVNRDEMQAWIMKHNADGVTTQPPADHGSSVEPGSNLGSRLCPRERRPFQDATALRQHIESAAHIEPFIHRPTSMLLGERGNSKVSRKFSTMSGLVQQLESGLHADDYDTDTFWSYVEECCQTVGIELKLAQGSGN